MESPGRKAVVAMKSLQGQVEVFKKPFDVTRKRRKEIVLDEGTYVEEMGRIIQRDFFPDLEKLKVQNEYLDAVEKNDVIKIRELHSKYTGHRTPAERVPSPATFETPANIHNSQGPRVPPQPDPEPIVVPEKRKTSLDEYLSSHTSEDNRSFEEIMEESERRRRQKYSHLYNDEERCLEEKAKTLALPSIEQQAALPEKKLDVDTWSYRNRNHIMYVPDGVGQTDEELVEAAQKRMEIVHSNTRLSTNPFNDVQSKETITELAKKQAKVLDGKIGVDGKELVTGTPKINGFGLVRTPSPCPGVAQSPLMTWGEVEGTPFKLDGSDTPLPRAHGPSFKMNEPPKREQLAIALAEKASERHRDKKRKAMDAARRQFASPSPRPNSTTIERLSAMSPAAQRLATSRFRLGLTSPGGSAYSPSPRSLAKTPRTPARTGTPKLNLGIRKAVDDDNNLTDDLLKINVPRRQKASDFF